MNIEEHVAYFSSVAQIIPILFLAEAVELRMGPITMVGLLRGESVTADRFFFVASLVSVAVGELCAVSALAFAQVLSQDPDWRQATMAVVSALALVILLATTFIALAHQQSEAYENWKAREAQRRHGSEGGIPGASGESHAP